jgi:hypothetical protein
MAAITGFIERNDVHETIKPYAWNGPDIPYLPRSNFEVKEMEVSFSVSSKRAARDRPDTQPLPDKLDRYANAT